MLIHRAWALGTLAVLAVVASWDVWRSKVDAIPAWWIASAVIGAWGMVVTTAWHGGELVYQHGLGVLSLPATESYQRHGHEHGSTMDSGEHAHGSVIPSENDAHEHPHDGHAH
jgi:hypothetical protein